jgi:hypothetical protein
MNNPISSAPEHALYPHPPGCTGHRILGLLQSRLPDVTRAQYLQAFDRRNLLSSRVWNRGQAMEAGLNFVREMRDTGATVVVLGAQTRDALRLRHELVLPIVEHGVTWRQLPHPSGRNLWYNDPECAALAAMLLEELFLKSGGEE